VIPLSDKGDGELSTHGAARGWVRTCMQQVEDMELRLRVQSRAGRPPATSATPAVQGESPTDPPVVRP
jgi:hypothetical protein